jgi:hypothetical protein
VREELNEAIIAEIERVRARIFLHVEGVKDELEELKEDIAFLALHLDALQDINKRDFLQIVTMVFGTSAPAALEEVKKVRSLSKRSKVDKAYLQEVNILERPPAKQPKKQKPGSPIMKVAALQAEILAAAERGFNPQEREVIAQILNKLVNKYGG